jgi:hypothetical protein
MMCRQISLGTCWTRLALMMCSHNSQDLMDRINPDEVLAIKSRDLLDIINPVDVSTNNHWDLSVTTFPAIVTAHIYIGLSVTRNLFMSKRLFSELVGQGCS